MLNKAICKRCWNERNPNCPWDKYDEDWWKRGVVYCGGQKEYGWVIFGWSDVNKEPHKNCLYFLEQTLYSMSQETEEKRDAQ